MRTFPVAGKALTLAKKAQRHHARSSIAGKALPLDSKARRHNAHSPIVGKALPLASNTVWYHVHLPITVKALLPVLKALRHHALSTVAGKVVPPATQAPGYYELSHLRKADAAGRVGQAAFRTYLTRCGDAGTPFLPKPSLPSLMVGQLTTPAPS